MFNSSYQATRRYHFRLSLTFTVFVSKLESLDETESLFNWPTDRKVVDGDLSQVLLIVNDEQATEGDSFILLEKQNEYTYM